MAKQEGWTSLKRILFLLYKTRNGVKKKRHGTDILPTITSSVHKIMTTGVTVFTHGNTNDMPMLMLNPMWLHITLPFLALDNHVEQGKETHSMRISDCLPSGSIYCRIKEKLKIELKEKH